MSNKARTYAAVCPICEKKLFNLNQGTARGVICSKCKTKFTVIIEPGTVQIKEDSAEYTAGKNKATVI